ncbi:hypothetical protein MTR67_045072 [Solanum verrucosum]|uniref:Uncharacterized protein n=1 Tax=Solanum verrucosum TaxID=315347 RepID=A0AAF0USN2_SOLVR|nr:hypothetical protein MTR67_045072 [Solanum verrucosum]
MAEKVDVVFNYGGNKVKQLLCLGPSNKYYQVEGDSGIRTLQIASSTQSSVLQLQLFVVGEVEDIVPALDMNQLNEPFPITIDAVIDSDFSQLIESLPITIDTRINDDINQLNEACPVTIYAVTDGESSEEEKGENEPFASGHDSDELEIFLGGKRKRKVKKGQGFEIKTLETKHTCQEAFMNIRATQQALAHYFKNKVQNNPKYKVKDMRQDVDDPFSLNISYSKMKRVKRLILEKLEGSFIDDFNKLEVFEEVQKEISYRPQLKLYAEIVSCLGSNGLLEDINCLIMALKMESSLEPHVEGFYALLESLMKFNLTRLALEVFYLMKLRGCDPDKLTFKLLINGLESNEETNLSDFVRQEAEKYYGQSLDFLDETEEEVPRLKTMY